MRRVAALRAAGESAGRGEGRRGFIMPLHRSR
jgi:hypothetical protein